MTTGLVWHERYMWHDTRHAAAAFPSGGWIEPDTHAENPLTKRRLKNLMDASGITPQLRVDRAAHGHGRGDLPLPRALLRRPHQGAVGRQRRRCGRADAVRARLVRDRPALGGRRDGRLRRRARRRGRQRLRALPPARPPRARGRGDGLLPLRQRRGRGAPPARRARARDASRSSTGTSTTATAPRARSTTIPSVLTISLHQDGCFPLFSGAVEDNGEGAGAGANINIPLPRGGGRGAYVAAFERVVVPALERFAPDFIIVANGLDAGAMDPLGRMQMHSDGYRELTKLMMGAADRLLRGPPRRRARGRLLVGLRAVLRPRDRRAALGPRRAASRIRCSSSSAPRAATSSPRTRTRRSRRCEPLVEKVPAA